MKNNREKTITIVAIIASVLVLSVGFAAFTGSLKFSLSASVNSDSSAFKVQFSSGTTTSSVKTSESISASNKTTGLTAGSATLDNSASTPTMSNTEVVLTKPGDFAEYSFYAVNTGEFDAYLDSITYTLNSGSFVTCTASTGTDATLVSNACSAIKVKVTVGSVETETTKTGIVNHKLEKGSYEQVKVRIYYDENGSRADGNFSVSIGDISLSYTSIGGATIATSSSQETGTKICRLTNGTKGSVGSKYECDVNDDDPFTFYLLSTNTTNNEVTSYNLIMERNICDDGTVATETTPCHVLWDSSKIRTNGPVTATTYLNQATSTWDSKLSLNITFNDDDDGDTSNYSNFVFNGHARLPYRQELLNAGCSSSSGSCPTWLVGYLEPDEDVTGTTTIDGIYGYWTASTRTGESNQVWRVSYYGTVVEATLSTTKTLAGVRPVIQVNVSDVE